MRIAIIFCLSFITGIMPGQTPLCRLHVEAQLVTKSLDLKPVPKLKLFIRSTVATRSQKLSTGFDGKADAELPCGTYSIRSEEELQFEGSNYRWDSKFDLYEGKVTTVELSRDNAIKTAEHTPNDIGDRITDRLTTFFSKYSSSVVTVWSEFGHGTGFLCDDSGLIITNEHVVGNSKYIAVQADAETKVSARLLASDAEKDVAILWISRAALPTASVAPLAPKDPGGQLAVVGERVFTIGSPLNQRKILTTGIVSKVEKRAIISDININPGNSGGPLFNSVGFVIGITTFLEHGASGPGISGIVRIEEVEPILEAARKQMQEKDPPSSSLLPTEPLKPYPLSVLKRTILTEKVDLRPYVFEVGDFVVSIITPILKYELSEQSNLSTAREKAKRNHSKGAPATVLQPLDDLRNWAEYLGAYNSVILIRVSPKLRETFSSALLRGMTATSYGASTIPAKMRFKSDFYGLKLTCGGNDIAPIHPGKILKSIDLQTSVLNATDAAYEGLYVFGPRAISRSCGAVGLEIYSEQNLLRAKVKSLSQKTVEKISSDMEAAVSSDVEPR